MGGIGRELDTKVNEIGTENLKIAPYKEGQVNSEKAQKQFNGDRTIFSINGAEATGQPQAKSKRKTN